MATGWWLNGFGFCFLFAGHQSGELLPEGHLVLQLGLKGGQTSSRWGVTAVLLTHLLFKPPPCRQSQPSASFRTTSSTESINSAPVAAENRFFPPLAVESLRGSSCKGVSPRASFLLTPGRAASSEVGS